MKKLMESVPVKVLCCISDKNNYLSKIMREIACTYSHITKIGQRLEELKIITKEKKGRMTKVILTEKGKQLQYHLKSMRDLL